MTSKSLPSPRISPIPSRLERLFPKGSLVRLKACPDGLPGQVIGYQATRVLVSWPEPAYLGHHRPETLELVSFPVDGAQESA
jgi:hypothetical protein